MFENIKIFQGGFKVSKFQAFQWFKVSRIFRVLYSCNSVCRLSMSVRWSILWEGFQKKAPKCAHVQEAVSSIYLSI